MNETTALERMGKAKYAGWLVGIVALLGLAGGLAQNKQLTLQAYTFGWVFWTSMSLGCFGLMLLQSTLKAKWGLPTLRIVEAGGSPWSLFICGLGFIPIALNLPDIYRWAIPSYVAGDKALEAKAVYLSEPFFIGRTVVFFLIWIALSAFLRRSTIRQDETLELREADKRINWSSPGLVIWFVTMTFASTDWVMSLEPHYYSTVYGLLFCVGMAFSAMSLAVFLVCWFAGERPYKGLITPQVTKDFGNFLFTLTMLWGYLMLAQFLITWAGNIPAEVRYYINRSDNNGQSDWFILTAILIVGQFFVPFLALIAPRTKRHIKNLMWTAAAMFVIRIINVYWLVMPSMPGRATLAGSIGHWQDFLAFVAFGGIWFGVFGWQIVKASLLPRYDTRLEDALVHA